MMRAAKNIFVQDRTGYKGVDGAADIHERGANAKCIKSGKNEGGNIIGRLSQTTP
jgi:hypothetical protein